jgi:hypothetical protein
MATGSLATKLRSRSRSDVSPLIAAAAALHVADMELDVAGATKLEIF